MCAWYMLVFVLRTSTSQLTSVCMIYACMCSEFLPVHDVTLNVTTSCFCLCIGIYFSYCVRVFFSPNL
jgi:hypothetical protein